MHGLLTRSKHPSIAKEQAETCEGKLTLQECLTALKQVPRNKSPRNEEVLLCFFRKPIIAVVRQQFVMGINCSIFLYWNSFGANQRLALTRKSFRMAQASHCAVQRVQQAAIVLQ